MNKKFEEYKLAVKRLKDKIQLLSGVERQVAELDLKNLERRFDADWVALCSKYQNQVEKSTEKFLKAL